MGIGSPDSYQLVSPGGSTYELASFIRAEDGPDFGESWMQAHYAENPAADGGQFPFESVGVRTMRFPLLLPSGPSGLDYRILQLTLAARPGGAYLDLLPFGATSAVRFDIAGPGRWKPDYKIRHQEVGRRMGTLELDTRAFGYLPTDVILASVASVAMPGQLALDTTKLIGEIPGQAKLTIMPTCATAFTGPAANFAGEDFLAWSLAATPSLSAFWRAASFIASDNAPTLIGDGFAPASQALRLYNPQAGGWAIRGWLTISAALEPAHRGRFRAYAWARLQPSQMPWYVSADVPQHASPIQVETLASAAPIATL